MSRSTLLLILLLTSMVGLTVALVSGDDASAGPTLVVTVPISYTTTNSSVQMVKGITEPGIQVTAVINHSMYRKDPDAAPRNSTVSGPDGLFSMTIELEEGLQYIEVVATGGGGNTTSVRLGIVLDTTPPNVKVVSPAEDLTYTNRTTWEFVAISLCDCDWEDYFLNDLRFEWVGMGIHSITVPLVEGTNEFTVRVYDDLRNLFRKDVTIVRDTCLPELNVTNPSIVYTKGDVLHLEGTVEGAQCPVEVRDGIRTHQATLEGGSWEEGAEWRCNLSLPDINGQWDVTVTARDLAGNEARYVLKVVRDDQPPTFELLPYPSITNHTPVHVRASSSEPLHTGFINHSFYIFEDGFFSEDVGLWEGWNNLTVIVRDRAGNEARGELSIFLDTVPPTVDVEAPDRTYGGIARLKGTTSESQAEVLVNGRPYPLKDGSFDIEVDLKPGRNKFTVTVVDEAGNRTETEVVIDHLSFWPYVILALLCVMVVVLVRMVRIRGRSRWGDAITSEGPSRRP